MTALILTPALLLHWDENGVRAMSQKLHLFQKVIRLLPLLLESRLELPRKAEPRRDAEGDYPEMAEMHTD